MITYGNKNSEGTDFTNVIIAFRTQAEAGDAEAQYNLGQCYFVGSGVEQNFTLAVEWFTKAAVQGHAEAQYYLGYCHLRGLGVKIASSIMYDCHGIPMYRDSIAQEWMRKAAEQGFDLAKRAFNKVEVKVTGDNKVLNRIDFERPGLIDKLIVSEGVEVIKASALNECHSLSSIVIPKSVRDIDECVFTNCLDLHEIHLRHLDPDSISEAICVATASTEPSVMCDPYPEDESWIEFIYENTTLYVPAQSVEAYRNDYFFGRCGFIIEPEPLSDEELFTPCEYLIDMASLPGDYKELFMMFKNGYQPQYLFFWGHQQQSGRVTKSCLSQWYPCRFVVDGVEYNCAEQYMMAEKARLFNDQRTLAKILASDDPNTIKKLGRQVYGYKDEEWSFVRHSVVVRGNMAKFLQNRELGDFLLSTAGQVLVETSPYDHIWGIGMRECAKAHNPTNWMGSNELGFALMEVRSSVQCAHELSEVLQLSADTQVQAETKKQTMNAISIGIQEFPENGWAVIFAGGSSSGKSSLIRDGKLKIAGEILSTDTMGEEIMEVHNHAKYYETRDPQRLAAAEKLVHIGLKSRYGKVADRNVKLDFHDPCFSASRISAILSNGAHGLKKSVYTEAIMRYATEGHKNVILDMTGKKNEVEYYTSLCHKQGYRVAFVWVICNMSQALLWNHRRERAMKPIGVYSGHHNPKAYLPDYLSTVKALNFDEVWLVFNSTESWQRPMTADEEAERIVRLERGGQGYVVSKELKHRILSVLGPYEDERYISIPDMKKLFIRYRLMQKYAADHGITISRFEDIVPSFEVKDFATTDSNIKSFYMQLGMEEPHLPRRPKAVNNVVEPVRAMYDSDEQYAQAITHYPEQIAAYQKALQEWKDYEKFFEPISQPQMKTTLSFQYDFDKNPINTYSKKVMDVYETIQKAEAADVTPLVAFFEHAKAVGLPVCFFGAGGAASPATFATQLANAEGIVAQTLTPMAVMTLPAMVVQKMIFMAITASGGPVDMQAAVEYLLKISPDNVYCLTTNSIDHKSRFGKYDNVVGQMVQNAAHDHAICVNLSIHRDGFVGVNKHVGLSLLLYRAFHPEEIGFAEKLLVPTQAPYEARLPEGMAMNDISDMHILYGALGRAAANDMEGRMLEAGVMPAMATDFKNFTHGRHVFLNKHPQSTLLMLVSPRDEQFVQAMLKLIPEERPIITIRTECNDMLGVLQLMICTFYLSIDICAPRGINPFAPGAPSWGGKLWALKLGAKERNGSQ